MNCLATAGTILFFVLIIAGFVVGFYVGSFRTKRQAKLVGLVKDWKADVTANVKNLNFRKEANYG